MSQRLRDVLYFLSHRCFLVSLVSEVSDGVGDSAFLLRILKKKNYLRRVSLPNRQLGILHDQRFPLNCRAATSVKGNSQLYIQM